MMNTWRMRWPRALAGAPTASARPSATSAPTADRKTVRLTGLDCRTPGPGRTPVLPPLPRRRALFEERLHALLDVLGRERQRKLRAQEVERVGERHVLLAEHRVLAELHQHG